MTLTQIFTRLISFLGIVTAQYFDVWWLGIILMMWHCYHYQAYEIIVLGILIDAQFMVHSLVPWYTIGGTGAVVMAELLKPLLRNNRVTSL